MSYGLFDEALIENWGHCMTHWIKHFLWSWPDRHSTVCQVVRLELSSSSLTSRKLKLDHIFLLSIKRVSSGLDKIGRKLLHIHLHPGLQFKRTTIPSDRQRTMANYSSRQIKTPKSLQIKQTTIQTSHKDPLERSKMTRFYYYLCLRWIELLYHSGHIVLLIRWKIVIKPETI